MYVRIDWFHFQYESLLSNPPPPPVLIVSKLCRSLEGETKYLLFTLKSMVEFPESYGMGGGGPVGPLPHNPYWKWYQTIPLYTHSLPLIFIDFFSVLRVLGLKKASKFDLFQKCQNQNLHYWIFSNNYFRNELHHPFTLFWYPTLHM